LPLPQRDRWGNREGSASAVDRRNGGWVVRFDTDVSREGLEDVLGLPFVIVCVGLFFKIMVGFIRGLAACAPPVEAKLQP
jgi:hypothetical protein